MQAQSATKSCIDVDVNKCSKTISINPEDCVDIKLTNAQQLHLRHCFDFNKNRVRTYNKLKASFDLKDRAKDQLAGQDQTEARPYCDVTDNKQPGVWIRSEDIPFRARIDRISLAVSLEAADELIATVGVDLQQELAPNFDARYGAAVSDRQLHPADDPRTVSSIQVGVEKQVHTAGQGTNVINLGADRTGDSNKCIAIDINAGSETDETGQCNRIEQGDRPFDARRDIERREHSCFVYPLTSHVWSAVEDRYRGRRISRQQGQEHVWDGKHLLAQSGVE